jgi:hypothetical protein
MSAQIDDLCREPRHIRQKALEKRTGLGIPGESGTEDVMRL